MRYLGLVCLFPSDVLRAIDEALVPVSEFEVCSEVCLRRQAY